MLIFPIFRARLVLINPLILLGPQSRFGGKLLGIGVVCPHILDCSPKRVKGKNLSPDGRAKYLKYEWLVPTTGAQYSTMIGDHSK